MVIFFFVLLLRINFQLSWVETINYYSVGIREKQSGTVNVERSKNNYHERSKQVPKDWHRGDFDAK